MCRPDIIRDGLSGRLGPLRMRPGEPGREILSLKRNLVLGLAGSQPARMLKFDQLLGARTTGEA